MVNNFFVKKKKQTNKQIVCSFVQIHQLMVKMFIKESQIVFK